MKLIIKQYLSYLRERDELDVILPDLLSQMGLNVFTRPGRGSRQYGVDVGAVGELEGEPEKVYLFTIKAGDLTRNDWDTTPQSVRQSLNEIVDVFICNHLPAEYHNKEKEVCICIGGDVEENVNLNIQSYISDNKKHDITFSIWNGDKIAGLIQDYFLKEELMPEKFRSNLRKSLSLIDEPEAAYKYFAMLIESLSATKIRNNKERITILRQINVCLWILFSWAREEGNIEAAYLSSELTLLHAWEKCNFNNIKQRKLQEQNKTAFLGIYSTYLQISNTFHNEIIPHASKLHAISSAVNASCSLDVNLKLFDLLSRLATEGIWIYWHLDNCSEDGIDNNSNLAQEINLRMEAIKNLINNNQILLQPIKDDQAIDIWIAIYFLALEEKNYPYIKEWLAEVYFRSSISYQMHGKYPCILSSYSELLSHPISKDEEYRKDVTSGSILYPIISLWAALLDDKEMYDAISEFKINHLQHCNFQLWYPDEISEENIYTNSTEHGSALSNVCVERSKEEYLEQVFGECDNSFYFNELSAVSKDIWPLIIVACRHYRLPPPIHLLKGYYQDYQQED